MNKNIEAAHEIISMCSIYVVAARLCGRKDHNWCTGAESIKSKWDHMPSTNRNKNIYLCSIAELNGWKSATAVTNFKMHRLFVNRGGSVYLHGSSYYEGQECLIS